ncbi:hypothetical protein Syun_023716 [Stephania yunnanensis]|uniref:Uncharacterized protein n=1 Tax=Stephania yunnanensis TaxID=152371 RepID=A0AAP0FCX0_9MAGN
MPADMKVHESSPNDNNNNNNATAKHKERHIVTWTQQEDDILREQIGIHGTENWAIIAAKFKDKTTRQCRRRWYTYLNSDFKKGGWSPEEDMLLCEAQRIFGNRWTEIAKVVSGRTDNAVKNRFSTLCKKRAKHEALSKEIKSSCINANNKRVLIQNGFIANDASQSVPPSKKIRTHISNSTENSNIKDKIHGEGKALENQQLRTPLTVLVQNCQNIDNILDQQHIVSTSTATDNVGNSKVQGSFLRRDDPKVTALMQQAELLSSLAVKVSTENTNQSLENAWKEVQDFLNRTTEGELLKYKISETTPSLDDFRDLIGDLKNSDMETLPCWRQPDLYESPGSSDYSTGSTLHSHTTAETKEKNQAEVCSVERNASVGKQSILVVENIGSSCEDEFIGTSIECDESQSVQMGMENEVAGFTDGFQTCENVARAGENLPTNDEPKENQELVSVFPNTDFSSPIQVTPIFQSFTAAIPTPKFSESERHFLMKAIGLGSPSPNPSPNHAQQPSCRRALLHSL